MPMAYHDDYSAGMRSQPARTSYLKTLPPRPLSFELQLSRAPHLVVGQYCRSVARSIPAALGAAALSTIITQARPQSQLKVCRTCGTLAADAAGWLE